MLVSTWAQEAPRLLRLLPRLEPLRPLDARELAGLRVPGDEARDEEAGVGTTPGRLAGLDRGDHDFSHEKST